jgi:hypothetical protein
MVAVAFRGAPPGISPLESSGFSFVSFATRVAGGSENYYDNGRSPDFGGGGRNAAIV